MMGLRLACMIAQAFYTAARHNLRISLPLPPGEGGGEGESKVQIVTCGSISGSAHFRSRGSGGDQL